MYIYKGLHGKVFVLACLGVERTLRVGEKRMYNYTVSLLERCPHFRGSYVQASMDLKMCPY